MKIPSMGFTDHYTKKKTSTTTTEAVKHKSNANEVQSTTDESILLNICADDEDDEHFKRRSLLIPDQEILDSTESIYFEENVDTGVYELNVSSSFFHIQTNILNIIFLFQKCHRNSLKVR